MEDNKIYFLREAKRNVGKYVKFPGFEEPLFLLGLVEEYLDYYWIALDKNMSSRLISCAVGYEIGPDSQAFMDRFNDDQDLLREVLNNTKDNIISEIQEDRDKYNKMKEKYKEPGDQLLYFYEV